MPQRAAGWRIDPPVSVPIAHGALPAATAAAEPPDDPPGTRSRSHGFWTGAKPEFSFERPIARGRLVGHPEVGVQLVGLRPLAVVRPQLAGRDLPGAHLLGGLRRAE